MKTLLILFLLTMTMTTNKLWAYEAPEVLENVCEYGCPSHIENLYNQFLNAPEAPRYYPGMYSGECYHYSDKLDPDTTHYIGLLLNTDEIGPYMSPILQYFGESNDMANWSFQDALNEMSPDWIEAGRMTIHKTSATAAVLDSAMDPALVYWARQNLENKEIYFIAWLRNFSVALCKLRPNPDGIPQ